MKKHVSDVEFFYGLDVGLCTGLVRTLRGLGYLPGKLGNLIRISVRRLSVCTSVNFGRIRCLFHLEASSKLSECFQTNRDFTSKHWSDQNGIFWPYTAVYFDCWSLISAGRSYIPALEPRPSPVRRSTCRSYAGLFPLGRIRTHPYIGEYIFSFPLDGFTELRRSR